MSRYILFSVSFICCVFPVTKILLLKTYIYSKNTNSMAFCFLKGQFTEKYKRLREINSTSGYTMERVYLITYAHIIKFFMPRLYGTHLRCGNTQCRAKCCIVSCGAAFDETSLVPLESRSITESNFASSDNIYKGNFCVGPLSLLLYLVLFPPSLPP